ncbi:MAG TPA: SpoIIE family protein phosphatase [Flavobacteriales bacterium]|nr:SpoIIE family protein phosphatase [Flavobacteriales bacterium]
MFKKILSNGVYPDNPEVLNRKIRTSNLIAFSTIAILTSFSPLFFYFLHPFDMFMFILFYGTAVINFPLLKRRKYMLGFTMNIVMAYLYFIWAILAYGWEANLQFYLVVMCLVVVIFYDNKLVIKGFWLATIGIFFGTLFYMRGRTGILDLGPEYDELKHNVGYANLFTVFVLVCILMLFFKNENLKYQKVVTEKSAIIEEKNKEMLDSINYAQRIQSGLLPSKDELNDFYPGSFLYFNPKDIVSGDFYWFHKKDNVTWIACGDCTGHGVPGALMSVLGINLLNDIVESSKAHEPAQILESLRAAIIKSLNKDHKEEYKDGMDISLLKIEEGKTTLTYAGANNPIYKISSNNLEEFKATKQPVGLSHEMKPFNQVEVGYTKGDHIILFTDGFADQFGGNSNKKYMYKPFKEFLVKIIAESGNAEQSLHREFTSWRASVEQIDDVCVIGLKL